MGPLKPMRLASEDREGERHEYHVALITGHYTGRGITFYSRVDFDCFVKYALPEIRNRDPTIRKVAFERDGLQIAPEKGGVKR